MRNILIFITVPLLLSCCMHDEKDVFSIYANFVNREFNDRNGEDYIKLWVNDTLLFCDTYYTNYVEDSIATMIDAVRGMHLADVEKKNRSYLKIRICAISLDSVLFGDKRMIDSTFYYKIDSIPGMVIRNSRMYSEKEGNFFSLTDKEKDLLSWYLEDAVIIDN